MVKNNNNNNTKLYYYIANLSFICVLKLNFRTPNMLWIWVCQYCIAGNSKEVEWPDVFKLGKRLRPRSICLFACLCFEVQSAAWTILPKEKYFHEITLWYSVVFNKKGLLISHTAAHDLPNKMCRYEPTALIT